MISLRKYGEPPFAVAVIHGGPGAPGSMAPVARELARADRGVLEPLQTAPTLDGQIGELEDVLRAHATAPVTLIGSSWGAMLSAVFAARCPALVGKLILVGSGVYDEAYAPSIMPRRLSRLNDEDRQAVRRLLSALADRSTGGKDALLARLGRLITRADSYDPLTLDTEVIEVQYDVHLSVWADAQELRASGELLALGSQIQCPVLAIHGDYDPHPVEGIEGPLSAVVPDFRFVLLENCGHYPWLERQARDAFFALLEAELN